MAELILVVDDNVSNTKLMRVMLQAAGYEVVTAANAVEARVEVNRRRPALILMDLQMPEVDGYTLTAEFKRRDDLRDIPIVAVTAAAMREDRERALQTGCDGYVTKPIDTRGFAVTITRFLKRDQSALAS